MNEIKKYFINNYKNLIAVFFLFSLLFQLLTYAGYMGKITNHARIIGANNNDAEAAINVAVKTKLFNDNNWFPYGPVYYRITHVFARLFPLTPFALQELNDREKVELSHHYTLIVVSLVSLFLLSFLISSIITKHLIPRILITQILTAAFISNNVWAYYVLSPHPDMIYTFLAIAASILTIKLFSYPLSRKYFIGSACLWGIVASTKLTVILTIPAVVLCLIILYKKDYQKIIRYFGWALFAYMAIGFPQNFNVFKTFKFLMSQSKYSQALDIPALNHWLKLFYEQALFPTIAIITLGIIFKDKQKLKSKKEYLLIAILTILPFLTLISRKIISSIDYYTISYVAIFILLLAYTIHLLPIPTIKHQYKAYLVPFFILIIFKFSFGFMPKSLALAQEGILGCRNESQFVYDKTKTLFDKNIPLLVTPYVPFDKRYDYTPISNYSWNHTFESIKSINARVLILKENYYNRFLGKELGDYSKQHIDNAEATMFFYQSFHEKDLVKDPYGGIWKKTYHDSCGYRIWEKTN